MTGVVASGYGFLAGPGWNLVADAQNMLSFAFMRNAFAAGTASALVAGLVGYFVVLRASSFAAHAISHIGFAGAAGAVLIGINPVLGVTDRVMYVAGGGVSVGPPEEVITSASLSRLYQADVEVLTDSRGRIFVVGLEAETAHPHSPRGPRP